MIDKHDASHDELRLVIAKALRTYTNGDLISYLSSTNVILRTSAARELHSRGTRDVFDAALRLITDVRYENREIGAFVLGQLGTPTCPFASDSFRPLCLLLDDPYFEVREAAIGSIGFLASLGREPPKAIVDKILLLSEDTEDAVRKSAALTLALIPTEASRKRLTDMKFDCSAEVRDAAAFALEMQKDG